MAQDVPREKCGHDPAEVAHLKAELVSLQTQLAAKDQRIKQLEDQLHHPTQNTATQVSGSIQI